MLMELELNIEDLLNKEELSLTELNSRLHGIQMIFIIVFARLPMILIMLEEDMF